MRRMYPLVFLVRAGELPFPLRAGEGFHSVLKGGVRRNDPLVLLVRHGELPFPLRACASFHGVMKKGMRRNFPLVLLVRSRDYLPFPLRAGEGSPPRTKGRGCVVVLPLSSIVGVV